MATTLQKSHQQLLLKATLARSLRSLAPIHARITKSAQEIEDEAEGSAHSMMVPVWNFVKELDGLIKEIETKTGREFPTEKIGPSRQLSSKELVSKVSKQLREVSMWSEKIAAKTKKLDQELSVHATTIRDNAMHTSLDLESFVLPENTEDVRETKLLEEYRRLAGLPRKLNS